MELLDCLVRLLGCQYLSDLPYAALDQEQLQKLRAFPVEQFSAAAFCDAAEYITRSQVIFTDAETAWQAIVETFLGNSSARL